MATTVLIDIDEAKALAFTGEGLALMAEIDRFASRRRLAARIEARIDRRMEHEVQVTFNPGNRDDHMIGILDDAGVLSDRQTETLRDHVAAEIANDGWLVQRRSTNYLVREVYEAEITEEEVVSAEAYYAEMDAAADTDKRLEYAVEQARKEAHDLKERRSYQQHEINMGFLQVPEQD